MCNTSKNIRIIHIPSYIYTDVYIDRQAAARQQMSLDPQAAKQHHQQQNIIPNTPESSGPEAVTWGRVPFVRLPLLRLLRRASFAFVGCCWGTFSKSSLSFRSPMSSTGDCSVLCFLCFPYAGLASSRDFLLRSVVPAVAPDAAAAADCKRDVKLPGV